MFKVGNSYVSPVLSKYENSVTKMKKPKHKYYRVTANSMTSFELYMKVPDSITTDDIWMQRGDEILEGSRFKAMDNGWGGCGDWEYDDIHEVDEDEAKENGFDEWEEEDFKND